MIVNPTRVVVIGSAGFNGSHWVDDLVQGFRVRVVHNLDRQVRPNRVPPSYLNPHVEFIHRQACGLPAATMHIVDEATVEEPDQLRFMVHGGYAWEPVRAKFAIYHILDDGAYWAQWVFKCLSLLPGLIVPSRVFNCVRRGGAANKLFLSARKRLRPILQSEYTDRRRKENL